MKNTKRNNKIFLGTLIALPIVSIPFLTFSCGCNGGEKTNRFCINYLHNFDKTTLTLDLSKTNITHIPDGSFAKSFLETSVKEAKLANYNDLFLNGEVNIRKIIFPESIEYIGRAAFEALQIEELDFTNCKNLSLIDSNAFWKNKIKTLVLPNTTKELKLNRQAFALNLIDNLTLGTNIRSLENGIFEANKLTNLELSENITSASLDSFVQEGNITLIVKNADLKSYLQKQLASDEYKKFVSKITIN